MKRTCKYDCIYVKNDFFAKKMEKSVRRSQAECFDEEEV